MKEHGSVDVFHTFSPLSLGISGLGLPFRIDRTADT